MNASDPQRLLDALDPDQRLVAQQVAGPMAVLAGAGTGKTRAITYRIAYGVAQGAYAPANVLAVTFTARAAAEMRSRLRELGVPGAQARTFHSAALRQLQFFWPTVVGGNVPEIIDHKASLIAASAARVGVTADRAMVRDIAAEIEWAKVSMLSPDRYAERVARGERDLPGDLDLHDIQRLMDTYEETKEERGVIDFEDVLLIMSGILQEYPSIAQQIRSQYRHFIVDEYQDVSALQQHLLGLWLGGRHDLCVVGDVAQTIYSFAGATPRYLQNFAQDHPGARILELNRDYRSTPQIVDAANSLMKGSGRTPLKGAVHLVSQRPDGQAITYATYDDDLAEAQGIADAIRSLAAAGRPYSSIAILYRTNSQSEAFEQALAAHDIPVIVRGGARFFEREEIRRAMTVLRRHAAVLSAQGEDPAPALPVVEEVMQLAGWKPEAPAGQGALRERWDNLNALVELAREHPTHSYLTYVSELNEREQAQAAPAVEGVTLSTLHAAKGLEWDVVFLAGVSDGLLPISMATTPAEVEEEKRLLYVGITRARDQLTLSYARSRHEGGKKTRQRSRLLDGIWPEAAKASPTRSSRPKKRASSQAAQDFARENSPEVVEMFEKLRQWRLDVARARSLPPYVIVNDQTLRDVAIAHPKTLIQLRVIRGIGEAKLAHFGADILAVLRGETPHIEDDPA